MSAAMAGVFQRLGLFRGSASGSKSRGRRDYPVDDSDDDEYVPFIATTKHMSFSASQHGSSDGQRHLEYLSFDGRSVTIPETGVATTIKHSKLFIGCNVLVTALTLMLVAVALYADARHRTSRWYRGAEYLVLLLLSLDLWVEVSFQGCRRFHCTEAGGGDPSLSASAVGTWKPRCFSCYRCLGCCLSWTQLLLFVCSMMLFYVVNFHSKYALLNDEEEDADIMLGLMLTRYFLYLVLSVWHQWHACSVQGHLDRRSNWDIKFDSV